MDLAGAHVFRGTSGPIVVPTGSSALAERVVVRHSTRHSHVVVDNVVQQIRRSCTFTRRPGSRFVVMFYRSVQSVTIRVSRRTRCAPVCRRGRCHSADEASMSHGCRRVSYSYVVCCFLVTAFRFCVWPRVPPVWRYQPLCLGRIRPTIASIGRYRSVCAGRGCSAEARV